MFVTLTTANVAAGFSEICNGVDGCDVSGKRQPIEKYNSGAAPNGM